MRNCTWKPCTMGFAINCFNQINPASECSWFYQEILKAFVIDRMYDAGSWCSRSCKFIPPARKLDDESGTVAILFIWKEAFRALEIQNQKPFSLSRVSSVFLSGITPKTFSFYSLASFRALLWHFCIFRLSLFLSDTSILTHKYVQIHIYLYTNFLWWLQMYSPGAKPCSCPDCFLPQPPHNLVCKTVASAAAAFYFSKKPGFPFTWVQKQDQRCKVPQWCVRNMRKMRQRYMWAMLVTVKQVHTSR